MGNCYKIPVLAAEEFIKTLIEETNLRNLDFTFLQDQFHILSNNHLIDKIYFDKHILPSFYCKDSNKNIHHTFHEKLFEDVLIADESANTMNYYLILLAIFSSINHDVPSENFFKLITKIYICNRQLNSKRLKMFLRESNDKQIEDIQLPIKDMKNIILTYLEINIVMITHSVFKTLLIFNEEPVDTRDLENLVSNNCTNENVLKFYENIFISNLDRSEISYKEFLKFVDNKDYLFSFKYLRIIFFEFVKKLHYVGPFVNLYNSERGIVS